MSFGDYQIHSSLDKGDSDESVIPEAQPTEPNRSEEATPTNFDTPSKEFIRQLIELNLIGADPETLTPEDVEKLSTYSNLRAVIYKKLSGRSGVANLTREIVKQIAFNTISIPEALGYIDEIDTAVVINNDKLVDDFTSYMKELPLLEVNQSELINALSLRFGMHFEFTKSNLKLLTQIDLLNKPLSRGNALYYGREHYRQATEYFNLIEKLSNKTGNVQGAKKLRINLLTKIRVSQFDIKEALHFINMIETGSTIESILYKLIEKKSEQ